MRLAGKIVFTTGAGSGIGRAAAALFAGEGATVVSCDIDEARGEETVAAVKKAGGTAWFVKADVASEASMEAAMGAVDERHGALHVIYANAGIFIPGDSILTDLTEAEFCR